MMMKTWLLPFLIVLFFVNAESTVQDATALCYKKASVLVQPKQQFICNACLRVSVAAQSILNDPELSDKVDMLSSEICHMLPPDVESKCLETLKMYINQTISYLQNTFQEENLCYRTGLCREHDNSTASPRIPFLKLHELSLELSDGKGCTTCHNATAEFLKALEDPKTKIKIIEALLEACKQVENHVQQCKKLVFEYAPIVLSRVEEYMRKNDFCTLLQLCPRTAVV